MGADDQIFTGGTPLHDLFQKQVQELLDQSDLDDEASGCDADSWTGNVFGTRNQPCIH